MNPALDRLLERLASLYTTPSERLEVGRTLAQMGDPRPGVGLRADGLPDLVWSEVPDGVFVYQNGETRHLPTFAISQYPITFGQFQTFIDASDGFGQAQWWAGLPRQEKKPGDQTFPFSNHPREGVNWLDAVAFCRWLSARLGFEIRLPTEPEWEKAARGEDGRLYPWGHEYVSGYANVDERSARISTYALESTTAVGVFPASSASPYGVMDMCGNVWEWCLNEFADPQRTGLEGSGERALRGGAYFFEPAQARTTSRIGASARMRYERYGFRVVRVG